MFPVLRTWAQTGASRCRVWPSVSPFHPCHPTGRSPLLMPPAAPEPSKVGATWAQTGERCCRIWEPVCLSHRCRPTERSPTFVPPADSRLPHSKGDRHVRENSPTVPRVSPHLPKTHRDLPANQTWPSAFIWPPVRLESTHQVVMASSSSLNVVRHES